MFALCSQLPELSKWLTLFKQTFILFNRNGGRFVTLKSKEFLNFLKDFSEGLILWVDQNWDIFRLFDQKNGSHFPEKGFTLKTSCIFVPSAGLLMYSILIVEDHTVLAAGVERYLDSHLDSTEIRITGKGRDCLAVLKKHPCDIVLLDVNLPDINGVELCRIIRSSYPGVKIIALTGAVDAASVNNMKQAGASGYILKTAIADELINGIEAVMRGEKYISRDLEE